MTKRNAKTVKVEKTNEGDFILVCQRRFEGHAKGEQYFSNFYTTPEAAIKDADELGLVVID